MNYIDEILSGSIYKNEIIRLFYLEPLSSDVISNYLRKDLEVVSEKIIKILKEIKIENIIEIIEANRTSIENITAANIPQFSNIESINDVLDIVNSSEEITFELIGYHINKKAKKGAQTKYGENHYKLAALMGLTT